MLDELRKSVMLRLESLSSSVNSEQKDIDTLTLAVIEKINNFKNTDGLIPLKTPSEKAGKTVQCLLAQHGISAALYENTLFVKPPHEIN